MQKDKILDSVVSYVLTRTPVQAYLAELEREKLIEIRVTEGVIRAHLFENGSSHSTHSNPQN